MTCNKFVLTLFVIFLSLNSIKVFAEIDYTKLSADEYKKSADDMFVKVFEKNLGTNTSQLEGKALGEYFILTKINPLDYYSYVQIARIYDKRSAFVKAKHYYNTALNISPQNPYVNFYAGESNYLQKNYNEALKYYNTAYKNGYSANLGLNQRLEEVYLKLGDEVQAKKFTSNINKIKK